MRHVRVILAISVWMCVALAMVILFNTAFQRPKEVVVYKCANTQNQCETALAQCLIEAASQQELNAPSSTAGTI